MDFADYEDFEMVLKILKRSPLSRFISQSKRPDGKIGNVTFVVSNDLINTNGRLTIWNYK